MRSFEFKYGKGKVGIKLSEENIVGVLKNKIISPLKDVGSKVREILKYPIGTNSFYSIFQPGDKIAIVVSDRTRNSGAKYILPVLIDELNSIGIKNEDMFIMLACGTHRTHTKHEHAKLVGEEVVNKIKIYDHDCNNGKELKYLGTTSRGNKIRLNKKVCEADKTILTGAITYHYFAGYGGGRKSVLPGISAFETIQTNHKLLIKDGRIDQNCSNGKLDGNPIHEDMIEASKMLDPDFMVNTIMTDEGKVGAVFAGDFIDAHVMGCEYLDNNFKIEIDHKADMVIAASGGGGKDLNFVQSHKAMHNASYVLKDGGVMLLIAECGEGVPSDEYMKWINLGSSDAILKELSKNFTIPGHTVYAAFKKAEKYKIIWVSKLDPGIVTKFGIIPKTDIADALNEAYKIYENMTSDPTMYVIPQAYNAFPCIKT